MKKIDNFVGCYPVSKTLRFKAIPIGKTQENIEKKRLVEEDEVRAKDYKAVKKLIDRYHREFIEGVLDNVKLDGLEEYYMLFNKSDREESDNKKIEIMEERFRRVISKSFKNNEEYKKIFSKKIIEEILPNYIKDEEEKELVKGFKGFYTAFVGYAQNRENMYSDEKKSTAISYRIVNENMPRFITNIKVFEKAKSILDVDKINEINEYILNNDYYVDDFFDIDFFNYVLNQKGIDIYNAIIGGIVTGDGRKIQGLNECINLYNQENKKIRLPQFKPLYKQILSESESMSFYIDEIESDGLLLELLKASLINDSAINKAINELKELFNNISEYDSNGIYVNNGIPITTISNDVYGQWNTISNAWNEKYDSLSNARDKESEKYFKKRRKDYKKIQSFSLSELQELGDKDVNICKKIDTLVSEMIDEYKLNVESIQYLFDITEFEKPLATDIKKVEQIKNALDSLKRVEKYVVPFLGTGKEENRDEVFCGELTRCIDVIKEIDSVYNKTRNYLTKKPYSKEKFRLYFENPQLLDGWDINKESDYRSTMLRKDGKYYIAIMDREFSSCLKNVLPGDDNYQKMVYKQIQNAANYLSTKQILPQDPPKEIVNILAKKKKDFTSLKRQEINTLIDYCANDFLFNYEKIRDKNGECYFDFNFKDSTEYETLKYFYNDVERQAYSIGYEEISSEVVNQLIDEGKLYLFQLYNKDFSDKSHGTPNLHTMYFKALFDEKNNGNIRLNGGAEMFMRRASLNKKDVVVHKANQPIKNKNMLNLKKTTTLPYDIYKDKRFTEDQYEVHIPITMNKVPNNPYKINHMVRELLAKDDNPYVIGIDRGERNLIYVVVVDGQGHIVEQLSLNEIINENNGISIRTDYHALLDAKERERDKSRKQWKQIENIKELKEGYISQVVHKICELVEKYDAVIALEDLNSGFKNSRVKVEKQVYQKFEKMLITKLNYMVDKKKDYNKPGGVLNGYQLTTQFESFSKMGTQNGIMFYIPAWLTSKMDPTTGFVDLLKPKYKNKADAQKFFSQFDSIRYDNQEDAFVFKVNYTKFPRTDADYNKEWEIYTNGERIRVFRNPKKNNEYDYETVNVSERMKELFDSYDLLYDKGELKETICEMEESKFFEELIKLFRLTLQMRNSISGRTDVDYLISPVKNSNGDFYNSNDYKKEGAKYPKDADANGAYNIARKVLWAIEQFKMADEDKLDKTKISIKNQEWLEYAQTHCE